MKKPTIRFVFDRKKTATTTKEAVLYFEILHNGVRRLITSGISLTTLQWDYTTNTIVRHPKALTLNKRIETTLKTYTELMERLQQPPRRFDIDEFILIIKGEKRLEDMPFIDWLTERIHKRNLKDGTRRHHLSMLRALEKFGGIATFSDLTPKNLMMWDDWLRNTHGVKKQCTISNYHKRLRPYIVEAMTLDLMWSNPYDRFKVARGDHAKIKYLTQAEVETICRATIVDNTLQRVRDLFIVQIYTGLAYSDMYAAKWLEAEVRPDGKRYIRQARLKTNEEYYLMLLPPVIEVLERYNYQLPVYSNQKYNSYLKALGVACGIRKPITSHVGRHTFATTITLSNNVPIQIVAKMMGHSDIKTTQRYAKVLADDVIDAFKALEWTI